MCFLSYKTVTILGEKEDEITQTLKNENENPNSVPNSQITQTLKNEIKKMGDGRKRVTKLSRSGEAAQWFWS